MYILCDTTFKNNHAVRQLLTDNTTEEIKEEVLDICGWAFILYRRVSKLAEKAGELDATW